MATEKDIWKELRKPFDPKVIGQIPKGGIKLDYVGHAAVTDRLLTVDPEWTWEPVALDERGLPQYDNAGGLWIKLTIGGVTRLGYGDGPNPKERIGDALRNAAMRFGVALDLWSKDELESHLDAPELKNEKPSSRPALAPEKPVQTLSAPQIAEVVQMAKAKGYTVKNEAVAFLNLQSGIASFTNLPAVEFDSFKKMIGQAPAHIEDEFV